MARAWAQSMAAGGSLSHNPSMGDQIGNWSRLAENVGMGSTLDLVHQALLGSSAHYANLSDAAYSLVGIGVVQSGGLVWVVEDFVQPSSRPAPAPIAPPVTAAPAPAPAPPPRPRPAPPTTVAPEPEPEPAPAPPPPPPVAVEPEPEPLPTIWTFVLDRLRGFETAHSRR